MSEFVDFHYMPLEGKITGEQVLKQTEDAINDLGNKVYNLDIDQSEIDEAIEKSNEAINTANSALSAVTTGRSVWFNNVAEMVATDIEAGVTAETKGYHVANDGGNALYLIRQEKSGDVVDGGSLIALDNGNMAELVTDGTVNVKQFGAIGNGTDDDTTVFQNTSSYAQANGFVPFVGVATYKITGSVTGTFNSFGEVTITGGGTVDIINLQEVVSDVSDIRDEVVDETASAKAYSESAATSATNASNSASSASTTATQLMAYLEDKETITAPAIDTTLTISGAAADAKVTGAKAKELFSRWDTLDQLLDPAKKTDGKYWSQPNTKTDISADGYCVYEPITLSAGTYSFVGINNAWCWADNTKFSALTYTIIQNGEIYTHVITFNATTVVRITGVKGRAYCLVGDHSYDSGLYWEDNFYGTKIVTNKLNSIEANNIGFTNKLLATPPMITLNSTATRSGNTITQTHSGSGNHWWYWALQPAMIDGTNIFAKLKVSSITGSVRPLLIGKNTSNTDIYYGGDVISAAGTYIFNVDLAWLVVYHNLDLSKEIKIALNNVSADVTAVYDNPCVYTRITQLDTDKTLMETVEEISYKTDSNSNAIINVGSNLKFVNTDGQKYFLQVANGTVVATPVLPSNILYVGNSLLLGFGTFGMAASDSSHDYYHFINDYLTNTAGVTDLVTDRLVGSGYETALTLEDEATWRTNTLLPKLSNDLDLVIIQLGDNVSADNTVFEQGCGDLIAYIRTHAPNARVVWVGEWYSTPTKQAWIANACAQYGVVFVDISLLFTTANRAHIGDVITRDDGTTFTIDNAGVASHPSSVGMKAIADLVISTLFA